MRPARTQIPRLVLTASMAVFGFAGNASAEDVALPSGSAATESATPAAPAGAPARGITMNKVEAQFGTPTERHPAVGNPPITRWDYPSFSVFFERDHVIHSVLR